jgi:hypothetical protein
MTIFLPMLHTINFFVGGAVFALGFFRGSRSPGPLGVPWGCFGFFRGFVGIFAARGASPVLPALVADFTAGSVGCAGGWFAAGIDGTGS